jgi:hypothetical protein
MCKSWPGIRHTSLASTQKYIEGDTAAKRNIIKLI